jgi:archaellum component FlaC
MYFTEAYDEGNPILILPQGQTFPNISGIIMQARSLSMSFSISDFQDLCYILYTQPEWRDQLRQLILIEEHADYPRAVRELSDSVSRIEQMVTYDHVHTDERFAFVAQQFEEVDHRFDAMDKRFDGVDGRLDAMDKRFDGVDGRLDAMDKRFDGVDGRLDKVEQRLDGIDQRFDGVDQRFDGVDQRFDGVDQRFDGVDQRFDGVDQRFDGVDQRFDGIDQRLDHMQTDLSEVKTDLGKVQTDLGKVQTDLGKVQTDLGKVQTDLGKVQTDLGKVQIDVGKLKGDSMERRYRERPYVYFKQIVRRARLLLPDDIDTLLDTGIVEGKISQEEAHDIIEADAIIQGRSQKDDSFTYVVVEASWGIGVEDVERAAQRAGLLARMGTPALAAVAGDWATPEAQVAAQTMDVWLVTDGHARQVEPSNKDFPRTSVSDLTPSDQ